MSIIDFFSGKNKQEHENTVEYKKMLKEREGFKKNIKKNLEKLHFNKEEIEEVFFLIEKSYNQMEKAKEPLIKVGPNDILNKVEDSVKQRIKEISQNMLTELKAKIIEIQARKKKQ